MANTNPITEASRLLAAGPAPKPRDLVLEACRAYSALVERRESLPPTCDEWFAAWRMLRAATDQVTGGYRQLLDDRAEDARDHGVGILRRYYAGKGPRSYDDDELLSPHYRDLYSTLPRAFAVPAKRSTYVVFASI